MGGWERSDYVNNYIFVRMQLYIHKRFQKTYTHMHMHAYIYILKREIETENRRNKNPCCLCSIDHRICTQYIVFENDGIYIYVYIYILYEMIVIIQNQIYACMYM